MVEREERETDLLICSLGVRAGGGLGQTWAQGGPGSLRGPGRKDRV